MLTLTKLVLFIFLFLSMSLFVSPSGQTSTFEAKTQLFRYHRQTDLDRTHCVLPPTIKNGHWTIRGNSKDDYAPGDRVEADTLLEIKCKSGFKADTAAFVVCKARNWNPTVPKCVQTCPPLESTSTTIVTCVYGGVETSCKDAISRTRARFSCPPFYELSSTYNILFCFDGSWDEREPTCIPVCGEKTVLIKNLIIGGRVAKRGSYPWTVALYKKSTNLFSHICGASLISLRVIVTAAHCVTNKEGQKYSESLFRVAAGKYYRSYDEIRDTDAEFSDIEEIFVFERYKGHTYDFEGDIAVLVTKETFNLTKFIQPVCMDWDHTSLDDSRLVGTEGVVTGWGYTARGENASEILKELSLPYVAYSKCYSDIPLDYRRYVRSDKICAGYLNKGIGVCEGDSGGGLVFLRQENNRHYLTGIVSVAPQISGSCNENEYALYSRISSYIDFIAPIFRKYRNTVRPREQEDSASTEKDKVGSQQTIPDSNAGFRPTGTDQSPPTKLNLEEWRTRVGKDESTTVALSLDEWRPRTKRRLRENKIPNRGGMTESNLKLWQPTNSYIYGKGTNETRKTISGRHTGPLEKSYWNEEPYY